MVVHSDASIVNICSAHNSGFFEPNAPYVIIVGGFVLRY